MKTSTVRTTARRALLSALNRCIQAALDAQRGYARAAAKVADPELQTLFRLRSDERGEFAHELQAAASELGGSPGTRGSIEGALHRAWIETRLAIEGRSDATVLIECERGERSCLAVYDLLLFFADSTKNGALLYAVRVMIAKQHSAIRASLADLSNRLVGHS